MTIDNTQTDLDELTTFEGPTLGNWTQVTGDQGDWTLDSAGTPSNSTGQTFDNTLGTNSGIYLFTEATGSATGDEFWLDRTIDATTYGRSMQMSLYYNMYGAAMGSLEIRVSNDGGAFTPVSEWSVSGQQHTSGAPYTQTPALDLSSYTASAINNYTIRIVGIRGTNFTSDMQIDDVRIWNTGGAAPPGGTGGGVATACDTCHEFAPNDDILDVNNHPDAGAINAAFGYTPSNATEYTYSSVGDHIKHAMGDTGSPASPTAANTAGTCDKCHGTPAALGAYTNAHTDGTVQLRSGTIGRSDGSDNGTWNGSTCSNVDCHGNTVTPAWGVGTVICGDCHGTVARFGDDRDGYPPSPAGNQIVGHHAAHATISFGLTGDYCAMCHEGGGTGNAGHGDGTVDLLLADGTGPGGTGRGTLTAGNPSTCSNLNTGQCHAGTAQWDSTVTLNCTDCHSGITSHLKLTSGGADQACEACHPGGATNPNKHTAVGNTDTIEIPNPSTSFNTMDDGSGTNLDMQDRLGISYAFGGIHLGGESTLAGATTEADICWDCHSTDDTVNEWGFNTDTSPGFPTYVIPDINSTSTASHNYGWIYSNSGMTTLTGDWTNNDGGGAYRKDAYSTVTVLSRQIFSVHSANVEASPTGRARISSVALVPVAGTVTAGTATNLEEKANIRCSYCHDVHNLNKSVAERASGDNKPQTGSPYLRGRWGGNPYPPDIPPLSSYTYPTTAGPTANRSAVGNRYTGGGGTMNAPTPRLFAWSYAGQNIGTASLKGGFWIDQNSDNPPGSAPYNDTTQADGAGICLLCHDMSPGAMDYYDNGTLELWQDSGTINGHNNSVQGGGGTGFDLFNANRWTGTNNLNMAAQDGVNTQDWGSNRSSNWPFLSSGFSGGGNYCQPASNCPPRNSGWYGGTAGGATRAANYNTWYGAGTVPNAHKFSCSKCHSPHATGLPALLTTNCTDTALATWSAGTSGQANPTVNAANNCHRKTATSDGWNRLAPGE
ncbi:MAG: hypothetical protein P1P84_23030 [Deferrisomatales bacterium]|nr:hypothetical protein [Deferrisomatales bacterium]